MQQYLQTLAPVEFADQRIPRLMADDTVLIEKLYVRLSGEFLEGRRQRLCRDVESNGSLGNREGRRGQQETRGADECAPDRHAAPAGIRRTPPIGRNHKESPLFWLQSGGRCEPSVHYDPRGAGITQSIRACLRELPGTTSESVRCGGLTLRQASNRARSSAETSCALRRAIHSLASRSAVSISGSLTNLGHELSWHPHISASRRRGSRAAHA